MFDHGIMGGNDKTTSRRIFLIKDVALLPNIMPPLVLPLIREICIFYTHGQIIKLILCTATLSCAFSHLIRCQTVIKPSKNHKSKASARLSTGRPRNDGHAGPASRHAKGKAAFTVTSMHVYRHLSGCVCGINKEKLENLNCSGFFFCSGTGSFSESPGACQG